MNGDLVNNRGVLTMREQENHELLDSDQPDLTNTEDAEVTTIDDNSLAANKTRQESTVRRNIEDILEKRRLQQELGEDLDLSDL